MGAGRSLGLGACRGWKQEPPSCPQKDRDFHLRPLFWVPTVCETDSNGCFETKPWLKEEKPWPFGPCTDDESFIAYSCSQRPQSFCDAGCRFSFLTSWPEARILYHQPPRTVTMVVMFMGNFMCPKMLLLMACPSHCNHFPTMPTQEPGTICISSGICTRLLTQQKGALLVQRNAGSCDGVSCFCSQIMGVRLPSTYQLPALRS